MQKRAPTIWQLGTIAGFALSCFGILLFLWITFGGPTPLKAKGYIVKVPFDEAATLAPQSDVRISGVSIGKVTKVELDPDGRRALATIELDNTYAPLPADTRAVLRQKTLLGETYVEFTPGDAVGPKIDDGATLPFAQVSEAVQLDEIFRTFDSRTRVAFQQWQQELAIALRGRGDDLSAAIAELEPTFSDANRVLRVLDTQENAVRQLIRNGGATFNALSERQGQLRGLIQNAAQVFATTARRNADLQSTFVAFPTFLDESRTTLLRLQRFASDTDPLVQQLRPAVRDLTPVLRDTAELTPELRRFFIGLRPVVAGARRAFPALRRLLLADFPPLLRELPPFLNNLNPLIEDAGNYKHELTAFLGNATASINAVGSGVESGGRLTHYLRTISPLAPDSLAAFVTPNPAAPAGPQRVRTQRTNPYTAPLGYKNLPSGLLSFETRHCASGLVPKLDPTTPTNPVFQSRFNVTGADAQDLFDRIVQFAFAGVLDSANTPAPPCVKQAPFNPIGQPGPATDYQHVFEQQ
jgi:phospholipid/cholesterol/gamma-HCH transport system substrate-binding protein